MAAYPVVVIKNQSNAAAQITVSIIPSATMATGQLGAIRRRFFVDAMKQNAGLNLLKG